MLIYSNPFYHEDDGRQIEERDALCSICYNVVDRQEKYEGIHDDFVFSTDKARLWKCCPYCGKDLYDK
jgi:hypothetical protein